MKLLSGCSYAFYKPPCLRWHTQLVVDAPQSHRRPENVNGRLLPGPGIVRPDSRTLEGRKSGMPETVQDFDRRRGDLLQLQEPAHQLMTEEQLELLVIGRGQGAE